MQQLRYLQKSDTIVSLTDAGCITPVRRMGRAV